MHAQNATATYKLFAHYYIYHCIYHPSDLQCLAGGQASWLNYIICEVKSLIALINEHTGNVRHTHTHTPTPLCYITTFHAQRHHQPGLLPTTIIGEQSQSTCHTLTVKECFRRLNPISDKERNLSAAELSLYSIIYRKNK